MAGAPSKAQLRLVREANLQFSTEPFVPDTEESQTSWKTWVVIGVLTLLWHFLLAVFQPSWRQSPPSPPPVEVQNIDPQKLDAIRKQWNAREKQLLLNKDKSKPSAQEAPPDARYMSDRNIRVEKEQRARDTNVIPNEGKAQKQAEKSAPKTQSQTQTPKRSKLANLGALGVPMNLGATTPQEQEASPKTGRPDQDVGDQAILDQNLPEGSENLLNAQESVYYSFYARIYESIGPIWQSLIRQVPTRRNIQTGDYSTSVDVVFDSQGNVLEIRHLRDSGIVEFDQAVDQAWKRVGRFPNPPKGLLDAQGRVHMGWTFTVQVGPGFNLQSAPPRRNY